MLITLWKTEGHKKNVLKKDKFELMIKQLIINDLTCIFTFFSRPWDVLILIINISILLAKSLRNVSLNGLIFRFKIRIFTPHFQYIL